MALSFGLSVSTLGEHTLHPLVCVYAIEDDARSVLYSDCSLLLRLVVSLVSRRITVNVSSDERLPKRNHCVCFLFYIRMTYVSQRYPWKRTSLYFIMHNIGENDRRDWLAKKLFRVFVYNDEIGETGPYLD